MRCPSLRTSGNFIVCSLWLVFGAPELSPFALGASTCALIDRAPDVHLRFGPYKTLEGEVAWTSANGSCTADLVTEHCVNEFDDIGVRYNLSNAACAWPLQPVADTDQPPVDLVSLSLGSPCVPR
jgi:hypothetical protein